MGAQCGTVAMSLPGGLPVAGRAPGQLGWMSLLQVSSPIPISEAVHGFGMYM